MEDVPPEGVSEEEPEPEPGPEPEPKERSAIVRELKVLL
jgi:hypothetical protein